MKQLVEFVGRPSKWGNPFKTGPVALRIEQFQEYLIETRLIEDLHELRGKKLHCPCRGNPCHKHILEYYMSTCWHGGSDDHVGDYSCTEQWSDQIGMETLASIGVGLNPEWQNRILNYHTETGFPISMFVMLDGVPMVNRNKVMETLGARLAPGCHVVWLDQVLPMYKKADFAVEARIGMTKSTNHRFRTITIFRKNNLTQCGLSSIVSTHKANKTKSNMNAKQLLGIIALIASQVASACTKALASGEYDGDAEPEVRGTKTVQEGKPKKENAPDVAKSLLDDDDDSNGGKPDYEALRKEAMGMARKLNEAGKADLLEAACDAADTASVKNCDDEKTEKLVEYLKKAIKKAKLS